ncbi:MAG: hypothetical protein EXS15_08165 [Phycisphaerales bacterium]|nr:hypothetical protein [Phycisphaerales bacterium]
MFGAKAGARGDSTDLTLTATMQQSQVVGTSSAGVRPLVVFIFDRSGSMVGSKGPEKLYKLVQTQARKDLDMLGKGGGFDLVLVPFATNPGTLRKGSSVSLPVNGTSQVDDAQKACLSVLDLREMRGETAVYSTLTSVFKKLEVEHKERLWSSALVCLYSDGLDTRHGSVEEVVASLDSLRRVAGSDVTVCIRPFTPEAEELAKKLNSAGAEIDALPFGTAMKAPPTETTVALTPSSIDLQPFDFQRGPQVVRVQGREVGGAILKDVQFECEPTSPASALQFDWAPAGNGGWTLTFKSSSPLPQGATVSVTAVACGKRSNRTEIRVPAYELSPKPDTWGLPSDCGEFTKLVEADSAFDLSVNVPSACTVAWRGPQCPLGTSGTSVCIAAGVPAGDHKYTVTVTAPSNPPREQHLTVRAVKIPKNLQIKLPKDVVAGDEFKCALADAPSDGAVEWIWNDGEVTEPQSCGSEFSAKSLTKGTKRLGVRWTHEECGRKFDTGWRFVEVEVKAGPAVRLLACDIVKIAGKGAKIEAIVDSAERGQVESVKFAIKNEQGGWDTLGSSPMPGAWEESVTVSYVVPDAKIPGKGEQIEIRATPAVRDDSGKAKEDIGRAFDLSYLVRAPELNIRFVSPVDDGAVWNFDEKQRVVLSVKGLLPIDLTAVGGVELVVPGLPKPVDLKPDDEHEVSYEFTAEPGKHGETLTFVGRVLSSDRQVLAESKVNLKIRFPELKLVAVMQSQDGKELANGDTIPWVGKSAPKFKVELRSEDKSVAWHGAVESVDWSVTGAGQKLSQVGDGRDRSVTVDGTGNGRIDVNATLVVNGFSPPPPPISGNWVIAMSAIEPSYRITVDKDDAVETRDWYGDSVAIFVEKTVGAWSKRLIHVEGNGDENAKPIDDAGDTVELQLRNPTGRQPREVRVWAEYFEHGGDGKVGVSGPKTILFVHPAHNLLYIGIWAVVGLLLSVGLYLISYGNEFWMAKYSWSIHRRNQWNGFGDDDGMPATIDDEELEVGWIFGRLGRCSLLRKCATFTIPDMSYADEQAGWTAGGIGELIWSADAATPDLKPENCAQLGAAMREGEGTWETILGPSVGAGPDASRLRLRIAPSRTRYLFESFLFITGLAVIWGPLFVLLLLRHI